MSRNIDWQRARHFRWQELKYIPGTVRPNGAVIVAVPRDTLQIKADRALRAFERKLSQRDRQKLAGTS
jgi:hypothetical protein